MKPPSELHDNTFRAVCEAARPEEVEKYLLALIMNTLGLSTDSRWWNWLQKMFRSIVHGFSEKAALFDESVGRQGFQLTARDWLQKWNAQINYIGGDNIPDDKGPLLVAANHPGTYDSLALASILPRQDLKIIAAGNPFFRSLPNLRQHLILATTDSYVRMTTIRNALGHLRQGGAVLIFPSGKVDPDPQYFRAEARQSLERWSGSLEFLLRKAPQSRLILAINSGFVSPEFLHNPLLRLYPVQLTRQYIAEFVQVIQQVVYNRTITTPPEVRFSQAYSLADLGASTDDFRERIFSLAANLLEFNASPE